MKFFKLIFLFLFLSNCDSSKKFEDKNSSLILCYIYSQCPNTQGSRYAIVGDSWTDLLLGFPAVETLRRQLENYHGIRPVGSTLGGQRLEVALNQGLHLESIKQAGAEVRFVLLSLGGNDLLLNPADYAPNPQFMKQQRFNQIQTNLSTLVLTGNQYKQNLYGGEPLVWMIHGYDYSNPDKGPIIAGSVGETGCAASFINAGFPREGLTTFTSSLLNDYNEFLKVLASKEPYLRYIDLRKTLGGPPVSNPSFMLDCIHPNDAGFKLLGDKYANAIRNFSSL